MCIWNVAPVVSVAGTDRLAGSARVFDISGIMQYLGHDKWSSISQLIKDRLRDLQKLLKYFNETTTSASNIFLSFGVLRVIFVLYSKDLLVFVLLLLIL